MTRLDPQGWLRGMKTVWLILQLTSFWSILLWWILPSWKQRKTHHCLPLEFWLVCVDLSSWNRVEEPRMKVGWNTWNSFDLGGHICIGAVLVMACYSSVSPTVSLFVFLHIRSHMCIFKIHKYTRTGRNCFGNLSLESFLLFVRSQSIWKRLKRIWIFSCINWMNLKLSSHQWLKMLELLDFRVVKVQIGQDGGHVLRRIL